MLLKGTLILKETGIFLVKQKDVGYLEQHIK